MECAPFLCWRCRGVMFVAYVVLFGNNAWVEGLRMRGWCLSIIYGYDLFPGTEEELYRQKEVIACWERGMQEVN